MNRNRIGSIAEPIGRVRRELEMNRGSWSRRVKLPVTIWVAGANLGREHGFNPPRLGDMRVKRTNGEEETGGRIRFGLVIVEAAAPRPAVVRHAIQFESPAGSKAGRGTKWHRLSGLALRLQFVGT